MLRLLCLGLLLVGALPLRVGAETWDVLLRHGRVVDGTGNPACFADVGITAGCITALGRLTGTGHVEINATGLIVAPGFIDVHTHADELAEQPLAENFVRMGVTTVVAGNCGSSELDVAKFFREVERTRAAVNVATLIGHGSVRAKAMGGSFDREPTPKELARMKALVERAMRDGAAGLSTGLIYQPGTFAKTEEIIELARVVAGFDGLYASHMRNEGRQILSALDEVFRVAREAGLRAEVSHVKLAGPASWGQANTVLAALEGARSEGLDITQDQYVYTASSTGISQLVPDWALEGGGAAFARRLADGAQKQKMLTEMSASLTRNGRTNYAYTVIASCPHAPELNGLNLVEAAQRKRGSAAVAEQMELILELQRGGGASGVFHGIAEDDLQTFLRHPNTMVACDSGLREFGQGVPHPRGYGNAARVLGRYVRELKVLRLEDAVRKMTSLPAATFRFADRGQLRVGAWADVVVFDPATVRDRSEFNDPHHYPEGIPFVLVNGVLVVKDGVHTGARPGQALRRSEVHPPKESASGR